MSADFYLKKLEQLIGGTVTGLCRSGDDSGTGEFFGVVITMPDGTKKQFVPLSDDEGNAPGSFDIQIERMSIPVKKPKARK